MGIACCTLWSASLQRCSGCSWECTGKSLSLTCAVRLGLRRGGALGKLREIGLWALASLDLLVPDISHRPGLHSLVASARQKSHHDSEELCDRKQLYLPMKKLIRCQHRCKYSQDAGQLFAFRKAFLHRVLHSQIACGPRINTFPLGSAHPSKG